MTVLTVLVLAVCGGLLNRLRGDKFIGNVAVRWGLLSAAHRDDVGFLGRGLLALGFAAAVWATVAPWWAGLACGALLFAGYSRAHDALNQFGSYDGKSYGVALRDGAVLALPSGLFLVVAGFHLDLAAALAPGFVLVAVVPYLLPLLSWLAWRLPLPREGFFARGIPAAELLHGAALFASLGVGP